MSVSEEEWYDFGDVPSYILASDTHHRGNSVRNVGDPTHPLDAVNLRTLNKALANAGLPTLEIEAVE